jgi:hypothetical protein
VKVDGKMGNRLERGPWEINLLELVCCPPIAMVL